MLACVKLFLDVFVVPLLSRASFLSSLLALGGMLADSNDNIWCLPCHPGCLRCGRQQQLYLGVVGNSNAAAESAVTHLRCGGIFNDSIITNLLLIRTVK